METKRTIVKTKDVDDEPLELAVMRPNNKIAQEANMAYNMKVSNLIRKGSGNGERLLLRSEVEDHLIKCDIWKPDDAVRIEQLGLKIRACEMLLRKGGIKMSEARILAIKMGEMRGEIMELYSKRQQLDAATVEAVAEQYRFDWLIARCTFNAKTGKVFFDSYDDYIERGDDEASVAAAEAMAEILHGPLRTNEPAMFEVQWLKEAGFMNEHGRYVNTNGKLTDREGRLVDENGRFIDEKGNFIDIHGRLVAEDGGFLIPDPKPFIDDETGEEVIVGKMPKPKRTTKKRQTRKKKEKKKAQKS